MDLVVWFLDLGIEKKIVRWNEEINHRLYDNYDKFCFGLIVEVKMRYVLIAPTELIVHCFAVVVVLLRIFELLESSVIV
jgi:hypothetical protein